MYRGKSKMGVASNPNLVGPTKKGYEYLYEIDMKDVECDDEFFDDDDGDYYLI